jgi:hypothetical protein
MKRMSFSPSFRNMIISISYAGSADYRNAGASSQKIFGRDELTARQVTVAAAKVAERASPNSPQWSAPVHGASKTGSFKMESSYMHELVFRGRTEFRLARR